MEISIEQYNKMAERLAELEYKEAERKANDTGDVISRQAAIDALLNLDVTHRVSWRDAVIDMIDAMPSTQLEVIYCKDCMFTDGKKPIADGRYWCVRHSCFMYYCSDAERRTDESN